jgi:ArsR family transcriptional regulator
MDTTDILSFSSPKLAQPTVEAIPCAPLELSYAYHLLSRSTNDARIAEFPWLHALHTHHHALIASLRQFWTQLSVTPDQAGLELFWLTCELGYVKDDSPERLLGDLATALPTFYKHVVSKQQALMSAPRDEHGAQQLEFCETILARLNLLQQAEQRRAYEQLLRRLWDALDPFWRGEGRLAVEAACQTFMKKFAATGNVLSALPPHHFTQFEVAASDIRKAQEQGRLLVIPLYFSTSGGFNMDFDGVHYIGYGIQSESIFERLSGQVEQTATRIKALADPTRLMLLTLLANYHRFTLTVGDLALQLGVSQPTVSGHLKLLREAGFVRQSKQGNKALYQVEQVAVQSALHEVAQLLSQS